MALVSGAEAKPGAPRLIRIFCDADVLIAGAASTKGASHILLQLSELTLVDCVSSPSVISEADRNMASKLSAALPAFRKILGGDDDDDLHSRTQPRWTRCGQPDGPAVMAAL